MSKIFLILGSINAFLCVGLGAFGAHGLKAKLSEEMMKVYQTGVYYHFFHALGLFAVGFSLLHFPQAVLMKYAGWLMLLGILLFSGSLYALSITGIKILGAITPFGGLSFLIAWLLMTIALIKS